MDIVLFLCYFFPPLGGGGVQRSTKLAKYLPDNGWQPVVITVNPNRRNSVEQGLDFSLLADVNGKTDIIRCKSFELSNLYYGLYRLHLRKALFEFERMVPFLHMDYKIGWYFPALKASREIVKELPIKIIYSSSPPYSSHFLGLKLQKLYGLPWVADFRDPWTQVATYRPRTPLHAWLEAKLEHKILMQADAIIANTPINKENLIRKYKNSSHKIHVIPNGFDPADFDKAISSLRPSQKFVISCIGKFYEMPNTGVFFRAYRQLSDKYENTFLRLLGWQSREIRNVAQNILRNGTWEIVARIEHKSAVQIMRESSILLGNLPNERCIHWIPGKLYEYLAAKRPILFIGPSEGNAAEIIRQTKSGKVVNYNDLTIYEALEYFYNNWQKGFQEWHPDFPAISQFDRRLQAANLAQIFTDIVTHHLEFT